MNTYILCNKSLEPISFLYLENNENDYDKLFTVCTDENYRNQGMANSLLNNTILHRLNNNKNKKMILEVYNDEEINRNNNDVKQNAIMTLFNKNGFEDTPKQNITKYAQNNLVSQTNGTKIMTFNPKLFMNNNKHLKKQMNNKTKKYCSH